MRHGIAEEQLTVRVVEDIIRGGATQGSTTDEIEQDPHQASSTKGTTGSVVAQRRLPEPGLLELEELLSAHLNTRVKVDLQNRRGRLIVEFATLEDLERIYRAMTGPGADVSSVAPSA